MGTETGRTLTFRELTDLGYTLVQRLQAQLKTEGVKDGTAVWTTCPTFLAGMLGYEEETIGVSMGYEVDSPASVDSATFMLTKSMLYALYAGCLDLFKRRPGGTARPGEPGDTETAQATIGNITMTLTMRIVTIEGES